MLKMEFMAFLEAFSRVAGRSSLPPYNESDGRPVF